MTDAPAEVQADSMFAPALKDSKAARLRAFPIRLAGGRFNRNKSNLIQVHEPPSSFAIAALLKFERT